MNDEQPIAEHDYIDEDENLYYVPPHYPLIVVGLALLAAFVIWLLEGELGTVGSAALVVAVVGLVAWAINAPDHLSAIVTGRTAKYGGTSLLVTLVFLAALGALYVIVRDNSIRIDLTERDIFSLNVSARDAIARMSSAPDAPDVQILAFYDVVNAGRRDQDAVLFDDFVAASNGKIRYEQVDLDRNPVLAQQYGITFSGQVAVTRLDANGEPDIANGQVVDGLQQENITNAILRLATPGDFRAYFLRVENSLALDGQDDNGMFILRDVMSRQRGWTVEEISLVDLTSPQSEITLNDPAADGEVLVIAGGSKPLADIEFEIVRDYLDNGGNLIIFAAPSINEDNISLATDERLGDYLFETVGLRFNNDLVIDPVQASQNPAFPFVTDFDGGHYITRNFAAEQSFAIFELPHSIELAPTRPRNVIMTELMMSSPNSYATTDFTRILNNDFSQGDDDPRGPFVLAAAAENSVTDSRVVLFGSQSLAINAYSDVNSVANLPAVFNSLVWASHFDEFFSEVTLVRDRLPQDQQIFATDQDLRTIRTLTTVLMPLGILIIGGLVWWNNREKEATR